MVRKSKIVEEEDRYLMRKFMKTDQRIKKHFLSTTVFIKAKLSKWLDKNKTKEVNVIAFEDVDEKTGRVIKSITNEPFKYDWGVEIPKRLYTLMR